MTFQSAKFKRKQLCCELFCVVSVAAWRRGGRTTGPQRKADRGQLDPTPAWLAGANYLYAHTVDVDAEMARAPPRAPPRALPGPSASSVPSGRRAVDTTGPASLDGARTVSADSPWESIHRTKSYEVHVPDTKKKEKKNA